MKRSTYEDDLQRTVAQYLDMQGWRWFHCPNGARMGGKNPAVTAGIMKGFGLKRGVPDVLIFENWEQVEPPGVRFTGFGVAIELKSPRGRLTVEQADWLEALKERGWLTAVCRNINEVIAVCGAVRGDGR
jgi:hypothetical protein